MVHSDYRPDNNIIERTAMIEFILLAATENCSFSETCDFEDSTSGCDSWQLGSGVQHMDGTSSPVKDLQTNQGIVHNMSCGSIWEYIYHHHSFFTIVMTLAIVVATSTLQAPSSMETTPPPQSPQALSPLLVSVTHTAPSPSPTQPHPLQSLSSPWGV